MAKISREAVNHFQLFYVFIFIIIFFCDDLTIPKFLINCKVTSPFYILPGPFSKLFNAMCDHSRAPLFYIESVKSKCSWKAYPCSNYLFFKLGFCKKCNGECPSMGYAADRTKKTGKHYLRTNKKAPFCGRLNYM